MNLIAPGNALPNPTTPNPLTLRVATIADEPELIKLLHAMHAEGGLLPLDLDRARAMFARAFDRKGGIIGVIGPPGDIEAAIGLLLTTFWYTSDTHIEEYFAFVRPDKRRSNHARTLIAFARRCAEEIKIPLCIGVLSNKRTESKVRYYRQQLGPPSGAFFLVNSPWNAIDPSKEDFWRERPSRSVPRRDDSTIFAVNGTEMQEACP